MTRKQLFTTVVMCVALAHARPALAESVGGTISSTRVLTTDSELVSNVTCVVAAAPCLVMGASGISLKLNGFSITGTADPVTACAGGGIGTEIGIDVNNQRGVIIQGPGVVQRFRGHGVRILLSTHVMVTLVTASTNCFSGLFITGGSENEVVANISVRNGNESNPCGGICLAGGTMANQLRGNRVSGNGFASQVNNFGIGLVSPGTNDNLIVDNTAVGNTNGIYLVAGVVGNVIIRNLVVGNPAVQVSINNPVTTGVDIRNLSTAGMNTLEGNLCITSINAPCSTALPTRHQR
jgi:parallel beta-helix repeat protein